jgi:hypothetical protein
MIHKSKLYAKEQKEIVNKIFEILQLDDKNSITSYELDNDKDKKKQLIDLIPRIRKYYNYNNIKAVSEPDKIKRPWVSIIRNIPKPYYKMISKDYFLNINNKRIRTRRYYFYKVRLIL